MRVRAAADGSADAWLQATIDGTGARLVFSEHALEQLPYPVRISAELPVAG